MKFMTSSLTLTFYFILKGINLINFNPRLNNKTVIIIIRGIQMAVCQSPNNHIVFNVTLKVNSIQTEFFEGL